MLERIGGECAGAVSLLPEDAPAPTAGETRVRELSERGLEDIVAELARAGARRPLMTERVAGIIQEQTSSLLQGLK